MKGSATDRSRDVPLGRNGGFRIVLAATLLMTAGNKLYELILPLMMYELTHSSVAMATMRTAELLPNLFFAVIIGVLVDRSDKKAWTIGMVAIQGLLLLILVWLYRTGTVYLPAYYGIGFLLMTFGYGYFNVQGSLTKLAVPGPQLGQANARLSAVETTVALAGPALSAALLLLPDLSGGILATAVLYLLCLLPISRLRLSEAGGSNSGAGFKAELAESWRFFWEHKPLRTFTLFILFANCSMTVAGTAMIYFAKDELQLSSSLLALILSLTGAGGLAGSYAAPRLRRLLGTGKCYGIVMLLFMASYLLFGSAQGPILFGMAAFLYGVAAALSTVTVYTYRLEQTPAAFMGRVLGITGTFFRLGMPAAMLLSGFVMDRSGSRIIFWGCMAWNLLLFLGWSTTSLWKDRPQRLVPATVSVD
ncbi:MFS transporter [Paenibacillus sp. D51F]